ncbi:MAG TPA: pentapeptide repeat-containing protein [Ktedonobacteraceae bacterium]
MANQEHLNMLKQGIEVWNQWRQGHQEVIPDLSGAKLSNAHLSGAYLSGASVTPEQLGEARSLKDTIMPDGSKHP